MYFQVRRKHHREKWKFCFIMNPVDLSMYSQRYKREEAKITAWENLQKAKAEAAIKKLEVFL